MTAIDKGPSTAKVVVDVAGNRLVSTITTEAVEELGLTVGSEVTAVIKASDVILATS